jgi:hypothetical protein
MLSDRWNIWAVGFLIALFAGAFVAILAFLTSGVADLHGVLLTCVVGFIAGTAFATVRNWFFSET